MATEIIADCTPSRTPCAISMSNGYLNIDLSALVGSIGKQAEVLRPLTWDEVLEILGIEKSTVLPDAKTEEGSQTGNPAVEDFIMPNVSDLFPFCIPFDLMHLVGVLNQPGQAPRWAVPIDFGFAGYKGEFVLDMAMFEPAAKVVRVFTTLFFILGLILISRKVIKG